MSTEPMACDGADNTPMDRLVRPRKRNHSGRWTLYNHACLAMEPDPVTSRSAS